MPKGVYERRPRAPKAYPPEMVARVRELYAAGHTQKEVARAIGVTQKVVWRVMQHHAVWKGDQAGYQAMHVRVETARGKPQRCERCGSTGDPERVYDWANLTGRYGDVDDYERMCRHCHRQYDDARRGGVVGKRYDVTPEVVRDLWSQGLSINEIARRLNTSWPTVRKCLP
jgi:DNA invertase Pin-like site-specific DNA recombinase